MNVAQIIRTCRERADMSRADLAEAAGIHYNNIRLWELGKTCPSTDNLIRICQATGHELVIQKKYDGGYLPKWTRKTKRPAPSAERSTTNI